MYIIETIDKALTDDKAKSNKDKAPVEKQ